MLASTCSSGAAGRHIVHVLLPIDGFYRRVLEMEYDVLYAKIKE
jgi:hypothetical protein